jgi:hypothetical protein
MLPAHISLAISAHFRPAPSSFATRNGEKPRVLRTTWAFSHLPEPEPISFSTSGLHRKSSPSKGPKRPTFSPCGIFIQSRRLRLPFTGTQQRSRVAILEWASNPRSNPTSQGPAPGFACTAGILPAVSEASCPRSRWRYPLASAAETAALPVQALPSSTAAPDPKPYVEKGRRRVLQSLRCGNGTDLTPFLPERTECRTSPRSLLA